MTQYLLLEVDLDDDRVAKLVDKLDSPESLRIVGIFQVPRTRCKCPDDRFNRHGGKLSSLGTKYRWWVHRECGRPTGGILRLGNIIKRNITYNPNVPRVVVDAVMIHDEGYYPDDPRAV